MESHYFTDEMANYHQGSKWVGYSSEVSVFSEVIHHQ